MKKQRKITELLNLDRRVYIFIQNKALWQIFCRQAPSEGFTWSDGRKINKVKYDDIVALNKNMTFNYVGFAGHMHFKMTETADIYRVDFAKFINGADEYFIGEIPTLPTKMSEEEKRFRLSSRAWEFIMFDDD